MKKNICLLLLLLLSVVGKIKGQDEGVDTLWICAFDQYHSYAFAGPWTPEAADAQTTQLVKDLWMAQGGNAKGIYVAAYDGAGSGASTSYRNNPYVLYSPVEAARFRLRFNERYNLVMNSIFLHELGHIFHWHPVGNKAPRKAFEQWADRYMGFHMWKIFSSKREDVEFTFQQLCPEDSSNHYRGRQGRIQDAIKGWDDAHLPIHLRSHLFALETAIARSATDVNARVKMTGIATLHTFMVSDPQIEENASMDLYKFTGSKFEIIERDGITYAATVNEQANTYEIIGRVVPSDNPAYAYRIIDDYFYAWYITEFVPNQGYRIYSPFAGNAPRGFLIGEIKTANPASLTNK
jgi:hypothetical protein